MATTKSTNPKNADLEAEVLKAAGNAPAPVDQQAVKEQAQEIAGKAETMQGQPGEGIQMPGSNLPPVASNTAAAGAVPGNFGNPAPGATADPEYLEFLEWKKQQAAKSEGLAQASADLGAQPLPKAPEVTQAVMQQAEEAAMKAYHEVINKQTAASAPVTDQSSAATLHKERLRVYGEGYVVANRQGVEQVFTRQTWKLLGGRNNKDGYKEVVNTPPEVANLQKAQ